jgi:predicted nucleotidyltransferase
MVIGGLANMVWGRPRLTYDADLKVSLGEFSIVGFGELVGQHFAFRREDAVEFAKRTYVLLVQVTDEVPADLTIGLLPYENQAIERAVQVDIEGVTLPVCTAEDLIVHKAVSEREKDWSDIGGILLRQQDRLDQAYVLDWLREFSDALERPEILARYRRLRARVGA